MKKPPIVFLNDRQLTCNIFDCLAVTWTTFGQLFYKKLLKALHDCSELLGEYQSAEIDLTDLSNRYEFGMGFRVGAQLVLEMIKPMK